MTIHIQENIALAPLTTFKIGGPARYFAEVKNEQGMHEALEYARKHKIPFFLLAGGSNVLIPDAGLDALVICISGGEHSFQGNLLSVDAGRTLLTLIRMAAVQNLGGWEKLSGIPGTVGGAVRGNAGAFGSEVKDLVISVRAFHSGTGEVRDFDNAACQFSYRQSFFKQNPQWIITSAQIQLIPTNKSASEKLIEETIAERERRHIQDVRAAGSFFVNPGVPVEIQQEFEREMGMPSKEGRVPAGWMIEKAGLKGARVGGAQASMQHPNYIINERGATAADVLTLAQKIKEAVRIKFGITLEEEAVIL